MFSRIYIHIPFCRQKCPYCAFFSQPHSDHDLNSYVELLCHEMALAAATQSALNGVESVYFGGGTPSLLAASQIARLLEQVDRHFTFASNPEITLEANPGTVEHTTLVEFKECGVNRLSFGVQSFNDNMLTTLGRIHSAAEARSAYDDARRAGFDNIGIDLINSLPGQTMQMWRHDLESAILLTPDHLSVYGLTIEKGTPFAGLYSPESLLLPDEDQSASMFEEADDLLSAHGYEHYEIANYARPGFRSRHNSGYWHRDGYLGLGAGAHSFMKDHGFGIRFSNRANLKEYGQSLGNHKLPRYNAVELSREDAISEWMFLGLRMAEGVKFDDFTEEFGIGLTELFCEELDTLTRQSLLSMDSRGVRLTRKGMLLSNQVFHRFLL